MKIAALTAVLLLAAGGLASVQAKEPDATIASPDPDTPLMDPVFQAQTVALFNQAYRAAEKGDTDTALKLYNLIITVRQDSPGAYVNRAKIYLGRKDYAAALADYDAAIALRPNSGFLYGRRATVHLRQGDCAQALVDFNRAIAMTSTADPAHDIMADRAGRGLCLLEQKQYGAAVVDLDEAIVRDRAGEDIAQLYAYRAAARDGAGDLQGAIADYGEAIGHDPRDPKLISSRGFANQRARNYDAAIADYTLAIAIEPAAGRYGERGLAHAAKREDDAALDDFTQAIRLGPDVPEAYQYRAGIYERRKDYDHALADLDNAVRLAPDSPAMRNARCWTRALAARDLDGAIADCEAGLASVPKTPAITNIPAAQALILDSEGFAWFRKGDFDKAIACYDRALAAHPDLAVTLYKRGLAKSRKGDADGGKADIARALALNPKAGDAMTIIGLAP